MRLFRRPRPRHRRDWRRLWRYCRCGWRWRCPDAVDVVPMPYAPEVAPLTAAEFRRAVRAETTAARIARDAEAVRDTPPRSTRRPAWNTRTGLHPRLSNGRAGNLTPAQARRSGAGDRA